MTPKPIVVIYFPDMFVAGGSDRNWIYEYMAALNGETDGMSKWKFSSDYTDYHWFCFYKYDISEPELKVFYEKYFTPIQYEELKQMVLDSIEKGTGKINKQ